MSVIYLGAGSQPLAVKQLAGHGLDAPTVSAPAEMGDYVPNSNDLIDVVSSRGVALGAGADGFSGAELERALRGGGMSNPTHRASNFCLWVANSGSNSLTAFNQSRCEGQLAASSFRVGGLSEPQGIVGDRNLWIANHAPGANSISEISEFGYCGCPVPPGIAPPPIQTFTGAGLDRPYGIAIDRLADVWVTNEGNNSVTCLVGADRTRGAVTSPMVR